MGGGGGVERSLNKSLYWLHGVIRIRINQIWQVIQGHTVHENNMSLFRVSNLLLFGGFDVNALVC